MNKKSLFFLLLAATAEAHRERDLSACASVPTTKYCHVVDKQSRMALNIANGSLESGASAVQWEKLADLHDNWRFEDSGNGNYRMIAEHSNMGLYGT